MTEHIPKPKVDFLEQLRKNWIIIAFIASVIVGYTNLKGDVRVNAKDIDDLKVSQLAINLKVDTFSQQISGQVSNMAGDIKSLITAVDFIKDKVK